MNTTKELPAPSLRTNGGFVAAEAKLQELQISATKERARADELEIELSRRGGSPSRTALDQAAEALLNGEDVAGLEPASALRAELDEVRGRIRVIDRAIVKQRQVVEAREQEAGKLIGAAYKGRYREIVGELGQALLVLARVAKEEAAFRNSFREAGISFASFCDRPMNFAPAGDVSDAYSNCALWFKEALDYGFVKRSDVPAEWLKHWA